MVFNRRSQSAHSCCKIRQQASSSLVGRLSLIIEEEEEVWKLSLYWIGTDESPYLVTSNDWKSFMDWNSNAKAPKKTCCIVAFTIPMASTTWRILKAFNWAGLIEGRRSIFRPLNGIIPRQGLVSFIVQISFTTCWHFLQLSFMARLGEGRSVGHHHVANSGKGFQELVERPSLIFALVVVHHYLFFVSSLVRYRWLRSNGKISA